MKRTFKEQAQKSDRLSGFYKTFRCVDCRLFYLLDSFFSYVTLPSGPTSSTGETKKKNVLCKWWLVYRALLFYNLFLLIFYFSLYLFVYHRLSFPSAWYIFTVIFLFFFTRASLLKRVEHCEKLFLQPIKSFIAYFLFLHGRNINDQERVSSNGRNTIFRLQFNQCSNITLP